MAYIFGYASACTPPGSGIGRNSTSQPGFASLKALMRSSFQGVPTPRKVSQTSVPLVAPFGAAAAAGLVGSAAAAGLVGAAAAAAAGVLVGAAAAAAGLVGSAAAGFSAGFSAGLGAAAGVAVGAAAPAQADSSVAAAPEAATRNERRLNGDFMVSSLPRGTADDPAVLPRGPHNTGAGRA